MPLFWTVREYRDPSGKFPSDRIRQVLLHGTQIQKNDAAHFSWARRTIENQDDIPGDFVSTVGGGITIYEMTFGVFTLAYAANLSLKEVLYLDFFNGKIDSHRKDLIERCIKEYGLAE